MFLAIYFFSIPFDMITNFGYGTIGRYAGLLVTLSYGFALLVKRKPLKIDKATCSFAAWVFIGGSSYFWSLNEQNTFNSFIWLINTFVLYILISSMEFTYDDFDFLKKAIMCGGIVSVVLALRNMDFAESRLTLMIADKSTDANNLAASWLMPITFCVDYTIQHFKNKQFLRGVMYTSFVAVVLFGMLLTGSRTGLVGFALGVLVPLLFQSRIRIVYKFAIVVMLLILSLNLVVYLPENIANRIQISAAVQDQGSSRLTIWKNAIDQFFNAPLFGYGLNTFGDMMYINYGFFKGAHNLYISLLCELGLVGITMFLVFIAIIIKKALQLKDWTILSSLLAMLIVSFFLGTFAKKFFWSSIFVSNLTIVEKFHEGRVIT